jgi:hypothetical protein
MTRKTLINLHMYLSAFFAPAIVLVAISGGLYLAGIKGEVAQNLIYQGAANLDVESADLKLEVEALLEKAGIRDYDFEYVKVKGTTLYTRPTTRDHFVMELNNGKVKLSSANPDLQKVMMELHKGHGPSSFKTFQKIFSLGLLVIILSGLGLGISAAGLRRRTLLITITGTLTFLALAL